MSGGRHWELTVIENANLAGLINKMTKLHLSITSSILISTLEDVHMYKSAKLLRKYFESAFESMRFALPTFHSAISILLVDRRISVLCSRVRSKKISLLRVSLLDPWITPGKIDAERDVYLAKHTEIC
jgi:hypothetical protein